MIRCEQDTAVVILSYNGRKWHELFLPLIVSEAAGQYDVVLVDNASTDDTYDYILENYPTVKTLQIPVNHGFAHGYFEGLKQIEAKYYVLLSADFEVTHGWFAPLHKAMQTVPGLAACQPKIRYWKERQFFEYAGAAGGFMDKWGYLFCRGRIFQELEQDEGQYNDPIEVFWASGGCLFVDAALYHRVGGLDADLYAHMEEVDLCWRLKNAGYRIGYVGSATVYHVGGSVISYGSPQKLFYNFRNNLILLLKNETAGRLWWLLPLRLVLDGVAGMQYVVTGRFRECYTILRAHFSFYGGLRKWLQHRKAAQSVVTQRNTAGIYPRSVVAEFFIGRKKKFSELEWETEAL